MYSSYILHSLQAIFTYSLIISSRTTETVVLREMRGSLSVGEGDPNFPMSANARNDPDPRTLTPKPSSQTQPYHRSPRRAVKAH